MDEMTTNTHTLYCTTLCNVKIDNVNIGKKKTNTHSALDDVVPRGRGGGAKGAERVTAS